MVQFSQQGISVMWAICGFAGLKTMKIKAVEAMGATIVHLVHYQKTYAAPFGIICPQLRGAWSEHEQTCKIAREDLPHPLKQRQDELRKGNFFVCMPLRWRLLIYVDSCAEWSRYSRNYSGWVVILVFGILVFIFISSLKHFSCMRTTCYGGALPFWLWRSWLTRQGFENQIIIHFLFFLAKTGPPQAPKSLNQKLTHLGLWKTKIWKNLDLRFRNGDLKTNPNNSWLVWTSFGTCLLRQLYNLKKNLDKGCPLKRKPQVHIFS